ncbi:hypothetical protein ISF_06698 [Cordyceps fumosorosea ARSEF 2679]|uniref:Uncharacterized protein n=1 Tax=Cordyceps fumosorosea (strain ARSEF 2679) TaxID=1081104 RepID=A0A167R0E8_CORFA|nr:hypothetical protein ISF_06698 [Cordyceps fumosorosea ARSEF 2679]OAA58159.1 hypothetical protein ISF_06698 [Cordyceps fumosorosea ARSEF 2679]
MSRVTAPVAKLSRAISSTAAPAAVTRSGSSLLDSAAHHHAGAPLMPKYAELLHDREQKKPPFAQSRGITTTHRPTPQPSIAGRPRPLMQTFHSSASQVGVPPMHLDAMILPSMDLAPAAPAGPRVPLLPDNYGVAHAPAPPVPEAAFSKPTIFAAEPDRVAPATPLSAVEGLALDGIELKFAHDVPAAAAADGEHGRMIRDLWKGMVDDVLGPVPKTI